MLVFHCSVSGADSCPFYSVESRSCIGPHGGMLTMPLMMEDQAIPIGRGSLTLTVNLGEIEMRFSGQVCVWQVPWYPVSRS